MGGIKVAKLFCGDSKGCPVAANTGLFASRGPPPPAAADTGGPEPRKRCCCWYWGCGGGCEVGA